MDAPKLFLYEPKKQLVSAAEAADLVTHESANCHDFFANENAHTPDVATLDSMIRELRFDPHDRDAYLIHQSLLLAADAARSGAYGIAAILANTRGDAIDVIDSEKNTRGEEGENPFFDHAEERLIFRAAPYLVQHRGNPDDLLTVNLCPCSTCLGKIAKAHIPKVLIGTIDPGVGAAFLRGRDRRFALGAPRAERYEKEGSEFRFPEVADPQVRELLLRLSWQIFHTSKNTTKRP